MERYIFCLFILSSVVINSESTYQECGSPLGKLIELEVSKCNNSHPNCVLHRNTNCSITIKFSAKQDIDKIKAVVYGIVMGMPVNFPLPNGDGCVDSGLTCPLKKGETYTYVAQLPVLQSYPKLMVNVKWELQLDTGVVEASPSGNVEDVSRNIVCVVIPSRIQ